MTESDVVFLKDSGQAKKGETKTVIKDDYVKFLNRTGGVVEVKFRAPREELIDTYQFFNSVKDMEPVGMDIASSGDRWNHYFRGVSSLVEDGEGYKFKVTLQIRDAGPR